MKETPILITGCARSGTSLTAGILERCGAWGGVMTGKNSNNQRGSYENIDIRQHLVKPFLKKISADPMGQNPLPKEEKVLENLSSYASHFRDFVSHILEKQGWDGETPWFYKGAKMCLIWQIWHKAFPRAKWVIVRREDYDICSSCLRTNFMRAFNRRGGWQFWVDEHKRKFEEMKKANLNIVEFWPFKVVDGNMAYAKKMVKSLGLDFNGKEINEFISPDLWHFTEERGV